MGRNHGLCTQWSSIQPEKRTKVCEEMDGTKYHNVK
jgi:hypothetical protein